MTSEPTGAPSVTTVELLSNEDEPIAILGVCGQTVRMTYLADKGGGLAFVWSRETLREAERTAILAWCREQWRSELPLDVDFRLEGQDADDEPYAYERFLRP